MPTCSRCTPFKPIHQLTFFADALSESGNFPIPNIYIYIYLILNIEIIINFILNIDFKLNSFSLTFLQ